MQLSPSSKLILTGVATRLPLKGRVSSGGVGGGGMRSRSYSGGCGGEGMLCVGLQPSLFLELTVQMHVCPLRGKRQWKHFYAHLKGFLLYFAPISGSILLEISIANGAVGWYQFPYSCQHPIK